MQPHIKRVKQAINELKQGKMIILTDHPSREDEGDLIYPAEVITKEIVNFMIRNGSGIVCLSLLPNQIKKLGLTYMVPPHENTSQRHTPFTVSIEAKDKVTTGVSAQDRVETILTAIKDNVTPDEIVKPGHVFPLHANEGGVLARAGHTEGAIDMAKLAGFKPACVLCEVMNPDGTMAKGDELRQFAKKHQLTILSIEDLVAYRMSCEDLIAEEVSTQLPLEDYGIFDISICREKLNGYEHIVLSRENKSDQPLLVRVHSSCVTGDLFGSKRCDCNQQLNYSLKRIAEEGGMLIYLQQEGRGIGLFNKIKTYALQEQGMDTVEANKYLGLPVDSRQYYIAANILRNKKINCIRLLTNNPDKISGLKKYGIEMVEQETILVSCNQYNKNYLLAKKEKLNHQIELSTVKRC